MDGNRGQRPRIAFVHQPWSVMYPGEVGADSVVLWTDQVARRLARECDVICYSRAARGLPDVQMVEGVEHRRVSGQIDRYVKHGFQKLDAWRLLSPTRPGFASPLVYRHFVWQVARDLERRGADIVHVHNTTQFLPVLRDHLPHARLGIQMHCEWLTQLDRNMIAGRIRHADLIVGVSDHVTTKVRRRFPEFAARCRRIWNGADVDQFDVAGSADRASRPVKRILYVGRISPEKGLHTLLDAFAIVAHQREDVRLEIVGPERVVTFGFIMPFCDDPKVLAMERWYRAPVGYMEHLRAQAATLPAGRVELLEREVPHRELPRYYAAADVFAFPSIWDEPFGMPLVEAMAAGLPCVATRGGAFPEIVQEGRTGLLVPRDDPQALAAAILRLCANDAERLSMGQAARRRARELFSWDHVAASFLREYAQTVPRAVAPRPAAAGQSA